MSMVDLPSREQLAKAISPWWRGGGSAEIILNVLRGAEANVEEARAVAQKMSETADRGYRVTAEMVAYDLADLRSAAHRKENLQDRSQDPRVIGSQAWLREAGEKARKSWDRFFPGEPMPPADPGRGYSDEADERYRALIRSQRDAIAETIQRKRKR